MISFDQALKAVVANIHKHGSRRDWARDTVRGLMGLALAESLPDGGKRWDVEVASLEHISRTPLDVPEAGRCVACGRYARSFVWAWGHGADGKAGVRPACSECVS